MSLSSGAEIDCGDVAEAAAEDAKPFSGSILLVAILCEIDTKYETVRRASPLIFPTSSGAAMPYFDQ
jgi:hypothetical protein